METAPKVVLITGGSSGIGKAIGLYLSEKKFIVYGTSRDQSRYSDFTEFKLLDLDVKKPETILKAVNTIIKNEGRIDVLINNAGAGITGAVEEVPEAEIINNFETNYFGALRTTKAVLPQMRKQNKGLIINVTSIAAHMGLPFRGIYSASKAALQITTEALRMEVKDFGIQITNLAPGDFATNIASGRYHAPLKNDSPYFKNYSKSLELMNSHVNEGADPKEVAITVEKIINNNAPKINYAVGAFMQKLSVFLKQILPDKMFEKLLLKHYKL